MKRLLVPILLVLAGGVIPATVKADTVQYALSPELLAYIASVPASDDLAVGEAKFMKTNMGMNVQVTFSAHGSPVDASGNVRFNFSPDTEGRGTVDCLFVSGNNAGLSGPLSQPIVIPNFGTVDHFHITAQDNGEPNGSTPDLASVVFFRTTTPPVSCTQAPFPLGPIVQGNIVIEDRPL